MEKSVIDLLQGQCDEKDRIIQELSKQCKLLQNECMELNKENAELKQKYLSLMEMTTSSKLTQIQSVNNAL